MTRPRQAALWGCVLLVAWAGGAECRVGSCRVGPRPVLWGKVPPRAATRATLPDLQALPVSDGLVSSTSFGWTTSIRGPWQIVLVRGAAVEDFAAVTTCGRCGSMLMPPAPSGFSGGIEIQVPEGTAVFKGCVRCLGVVLNDYARIKSASLTRGQGQ